MGFFNYDCIKAKLCCFPRVYSWFLNGIMWPSYGVDVLGSDAAGLYDQPFRQTPTLYGYGNIPCEASMDWIFLTSSLTQAYGIRADGSLWGWGSGPLGDGTMTSSAVPRFIDAGPWAQVSTSTSRGCTFAIKTDGTLWSWGNASADGQLGVGRWKNDDYFYFSDSADHRTIHARLSTSVSGVTMVHRGSSDYHGKYDHIPSVSFVTQNVSSGYQQISGSGGVDSRGLPQFATNYAGICGSGATGEAIMEWEPSGLATVTNAGSGYTSVPLPVIASEVTSDTPPNIYVTASFSVTSVAVESGGSGYTSPPSLTLVMPNGGSGFSATAVLTNGSITSVTLDSGGSGFLKTEGSSNYNVQSSPWNAAVTMTGGGGAGASLRAFFGNGIVTAVDYTTYLGYSHYSTKPTITLTGGGGTGAAMNLKFVGSLMGVKVTNAGSGYSTKSQTIESYAQVGPYVNIAFDRQAGDTQTIPAIAYATLVAGNVVEVTAPFVNWGDTTIAAKTSSTEPFTMNIFLGRVWTQWTTLAQINAYNVNANRYITGRTVEAKLIGGGLTWATGLPLTVTYTNTDTSEFVGTWSYETTAHISFSGSEQYFSSQPTILVKTTVTYSSLSGVVSTVETISTVSGTNWPKTFYDRMTAGISTSLVYSNTWHNSGAGANPCSTLGCDYTAVSVDSADHVAEFNAFPARIGGIPILLAANVIGSPSLSPAQGGSYELLSNFDGSLFFNVDEAATDFDQYVVTTTPAPDQYVTWCHSQTELRTGPVYGVYKTATAVPDQEVTITSSPRSSDVTFTRLPATSWTGLAGEQARLYLWFGDATRGGLWVATSTGVTSVTQGGLFSEEPAVTGSWRKVPQMRQVPGSWTHVTADTVTAVDTAGEVYKLWHNIGRPAVITCNWNKEGVPSMGRGTLSIGYKAPRERFTTVDYPERGDVSRAAYIKSSLRRCDEWSAYASELPNNYFAPNRGSSSDEKSGLSGSMGEAYYSLSLGKWVRSWGNLRAGKVNALINPFSAGTTTVCSGGGGYITAPEIFFHAKGDPLLSVTSTLKTVPAFSETYEGYARTQQGELWALTSGWEIIHDSPKVISRKWQFSSGQLYDSTVADMRNDRYYRVTSYPPDFLEDRPANSGSLASGQTGIGSYYASSLTSLQSSPVTHTTLESINAVRGFVIVFDDGGEGFDNYSEWSVKITLPQEVSGVCYEDTTLYGNQFDEFKTGTPTFSGDDLRCTEYQRKHDLDLANAYVNAWNRSVMEGCYSWAGNLLPRASITDQGLDPSYTTPETTLLNSKSSCTAGETWSIKRGTNSVVQLIAGVPAWRGSLSIDAKSGAMASSQRDMNGWFLPPPYWISPGVLYLATADLNNRDVVTQVTGLATYYDASTTPTVEFICTSGNASSSRMPAYRIVPIPGYIIPTTGQTKVDGNWSDFNIESGKRKTAKGAVQDSTGLSLSKGFAAPPVEADFVKTSGSVGLKSDGSLWRLGSRTAGASRVMGNLELKVTGQGAGYRAPVTAELTPQLAGVATATVTFDGSVVAIGVDNPGSGYRTAPTLAISGGAAATAVISGPVESATVADGAGGSGYRNPPRVRFSYPGITAMATPTMSGVVESVQVTGRGSGYTVAPTVVFAGSGSGASGTATISGCVDSVSITNAGTAFTTSPTVSFSGGGGSGATGVVLLGKSGSTYSVSSIRMVERGTGYTSAPTVSISGGGGRDATAVALIDCAVTSVSLGSAGDGYSDHPSVSFSGASKTAATACSFANLSVKTLAIGDGGKYRSAPTATFEAIGEVQSISLSSGGSGYSTAPEVRILGGVGSGAEASCTINGTLTKINILQGGAGYTVAPGVELVGGYDVSQGAAAKATATVAGGVITGISVTTPGSFYLSPPSVVFTSPEPAILSAVVSLGSLTGVTVVSGGFGYQVAPEIVVLGGTLGAATATIDSNGCVTSVSVTSGGSGYSATAVVRVKTTAAGHGATASAVVSGVISTLTLTKCGSRYDTDALPRVIFIGGGGSGAAATAVVAKSGSGGSATSKINGSVIFATITSAGSGLQSSPTVTVTGGGNEKITALDTSLSSGTITQEEYNEAVKEFKAELQAGITGTSTVEITNGGQNYLSGAAPLSGRHPETDCDVHGQRIKGGAFMRGPSWSTFNSAKFGFGAQTTSDSQVGGGGAVTSVSTGVAKTIRKPSVHFANTIGVSVETRLKVSSIAVSTIAIGSRTASWHAMGIGQQGRWFLNNTEYSVGDYTDNRGELLMELASTRQSPYSWDVSSHRLFGGESVYYANWPANSDWPYGQSSYDASGAYYNYFPPNPHGGKNFPEALVEGYIFWKDITPTKFWMTADNTKHAGWYRLVMLRLPWLRKPAFTVEAEVGTGAVSNITLDSNGLMVRTDIGGSWNYPVVDVSGTTATYSSGMVGRVTDPGIANFIPPTFSVVVEGGRVTSVTVDSLGNLPAWIGDVGTYHADKAGTLVVHGGGGTGAVLTFISSDTASVTVTDGGTGYTSTPEILFVPRLTPISDYVVDEQYLIYGPEHGLDWTDWPTWSLYRASSATVEYATGSTDEEYVTLRGNWPVDANGFYPFFKDGFVTNATLTDGGYDTQYFSGPSFIKNYTSDPTVTLSGDVQATSTAATATAKVVSWTNAFSGTGSTVVAARYGGP